MYVLYNTLHTLLYVCMYKYTIISYHGTMAMTTKQGVAESKTTNLLHTYINDFIPQTPKGNATLPKDSPPPPPSSSPPGPPSRGVVEGKSVAEKIWGREGGKEKKGKKEKKVII